VPILARNQVGWVTAMLGLIRLGALATAVNWRLSAREVTGLLKLMNAGARFPAILADADCEPLARDAVAGLGGSQSALLSLAAAPGPADPTDVVQRPVERLRGPEPCLLLHTSGTTGLPKLVPLTHQMLISVVTLMKLELIDWCRDRLAHFKCARSVDFAEQLPRNATGKVLKAVLREPHGAGQDRRVS